MSERSSTAGRLDVRVLEPAAAAREVAGEIARLVRWRAEEGRPCVLGLATGRTPLGIYAELARLHREQGLSFDGVVTVNLDELEGLPPGDPRAFRTWMRARLFDAVGLPDERAWFPPAGLPADPLAERCRVFEERLDELGGVDLQLLGLGRNGHIGFNEPGSERGSRTRRVALAPTTRADAADEWGGLDRVPTHATTLGVATILEARRVRALAFGAGKSEVVRRTLEEPAGPDCPATFLREHPDARLLVDAAAAGRA